MYENIATAKLFSSRLIPTN